MDTASVILFIFTLFYSLFTILCFVVTYKRYKTSKIRQRKPKLIIIEGGKKGRTRGCFKV